MMSVHSSLRDEIQAGDDGLVVATTFKNHYENYEWAAIFITEVRDARGITVLLTLNPGIVNSSSSVQVSASWVPHYSGFYELRSFAISGLDNPMILSAISSSNVTIAGSSGVIPVQVNNNEYEIAYSFNDTGQVVGLGVDIKTATIELSVRNVIEDGAIEVRIPLTLMDEFELVLDGKLSSELVVFVDNKLVEAEWQESESELVVFILLDAASAYTIEIVGPIEI
jgi:hypothetical protein